MSVVLVAELGAMSPAYGHALCVTQLSKLLATGGTGAGRMGWSVDVDEYAKTVIFGAPNDNGLIGGAFVCVQTGDGVWSQQGGKLVPTGGGGAGQFGYWTALSDDGNTALIGAPADSGTKGAVYAFVRLGGVWSQQGPKIVPVGASGTSGFFHYGGALALSSDGNTGIVGAYLDGDATGAAYVIVRAGGLWSQQARILPTGAIGPSHFGHAVALSSDGNTAIIGAFADNGEIGAAHVWVRAGTVWSFQQKLTPAGGTGGGRFGGAVALSSDGNTASVTAPYDNGHIGAAYAFARSGTVWSQQGSKIVPIGGSGNGEFGWATTISADGNTVAVGAYNDAGNNGAVYLLVRSGGFWLQHGPKLTPLGSIGAGTFGLSVALTNDAGMVAVGAPGDNSSVGAGYILAINPAVAFTMQPAKQLVGVMNGIAMFGVTASSVAPLTYQWRRNGATLANGPIGTGAIVAGATTPSLMISNVTKADNAAVFECVASNACGSVRSNPACLGFGPVCAADFNVSGVKSVQDLFDYLAAFFAACP